MGRLNKAAAVRWQDIVPRGTSPNRRRNKIKRPEQVAGAMLVTWMDLIVLPDGTRPGEYFAHVPNGGARNSLEGAILKGQGVRPGWPDYILDLPRGPYHGARMELKAPDGDSPGKDQLDILIRLEKQGYFVGVKWGFDEAQSFFEDYFALPPFGQR